MLNPRLIDAIKMVTPDSWEYNATPAEKGLNYQIFNVREMGEEFHHATAGLKDIKNCFQISSVRRIQNICMYGRYSIRLQQLMARSKSAKEEIRYICITEDKVSTLAKHNVDPRHLQLINTPLVNNSQLTSDPVQAIRAGANAFGPRHKLVLVMARVVTENSFIQSDAEIYPEYVAELSDVDLANLNASANANAS